MAITPEDVDLVVIPAEGLLPTCTTWLLLRRDRVLRDYTQALIGALLPQVHARDLRRAIEDGETLDVAPANWARWRFPEALASV